MDDRSSRLGDHGRYPLGRHCLRNRNSKLWLFSALLIIAVIALAIGWIADRRITERRHRQELEDVFKVHQQEVEDTFIGSYRFREAYQSILTARDYRDSTPTQFEERTDYELVWSMTVLWRYENQINQTMDDDSQSAVVLANEILQLLDCSDSNAYFQFAKTLLPDEGDGLFPELHDLLSDEHKSLKNFVDRAVNPENKSGCVADYEECRG